VDSRRPGTRSVGWTLQREIVLVGAWGPAILLQLAHPLLARAIADHSSFREGRFGRLTRFSRTLEAMLRLSFGTDAEARAVAARINAIHDRVHGALPSAAGAFPAGTVYSAHDPALLTWVHVTLVHMNLRVYELFVTPLSTAVKDRYCAEASWIEPHLGIPPGSVPRRLHDLDDYLDRMLCTDTIEVTDTARALANDVIFPPAPRVAWPMLALMRLVTIGLLPARVREGYGFAWDDGRQARLRRAAGVLRRVLRCTPSVMRHWPSARRAVKERSRASGAEDRSPGAAAPTWGPGS
jgi:uncharacterized protein (DUF2236 family)